MPLRSGWGVWWRSSSSLGRLHAPFSPLSELFRSLGRSYGIVGTLALLIALATGAILLDDHPWDGLMVAAAAAGALLVATAAGMAQARAMTRLRLRAVAQVGGEPLDPRVRKGAIVAAILRACIGVLTLALVVLGAALVD